MGDGIGHALKCMACDGEQRQRCGGADDQRTEPGAALPSLSRCRCWSHDDPCRFRPRADGPHQHCDPGAPCNENALATDLRRLEERPVEQAAALVRRPRVASGVHIGDYLTSPVQVLRRDEPGWYRWEHHPVRGLRPDLQAQRIADTDVEGVRAEANAPSRRENESAGVQLPPFHRRLQLEHAGYESFDHAVRSDTDDSAVRRVPRGGVHRNEACAVTIRVTRAPDSQLRRIADEERS